VKHEGICTRDMQKMGWSFQVYCLQAEARRQQRQRALKGYLNSSCLCDQHTYLPGQRFLPRCWHRWQTCLPAFQTHTVPHTLQAQQHGGANGTCVNVTLDTSSLLAVLDTTPTGVAAMCAIWNSPSGPQPTRKGPSSSSSGSSKHCVEKLLLVIAGTFGILTAGQGSANWTCNSTGVATGMLR
jgi:hypothetical protein